MTEMTLKIKNEWFKQFEWLQLDNGPASDCSTSKSCESDEKLLKCRVCIAAKKCYIISK